jgi:hypothetical protein
MGRPRGQNNYFFIDNHVEILCKHCMFKIDIEQLEYVIKYKWFSKKAASTNKYYAYSHLTGNQKILLHRYLLNVKKGELVDHKNGDPTDNRLINLRKVNKLQNNVNSKKRKNCRSIYKGVTVRPSGKFGVYIRHQSKNICLGTFNNEIDAAREYDKFACLFFGEYAKLNFNKGENI